MRWQNRRGSDNVEDRRGSSAGGKIALGGGAIGVFFVGAVITPGSDAQKY